MRALSYEGPYKVKVARKPDPQIEAREMVAQVEHATIGALRVLGVPVKLSDTPGAVRTAPPRLGEHTDAVLRELGINAAAIADLRRQKVI